MKRICPLDNTAKIFKNIKSNFINFIIIKIRLTNLTRKFIKVQIHLKFWDGQLFNTYFH